MPANRVPQPPAKHTAPRKLQQSHCSGGLGLGGEQPRQEVLHRAGRAAGPGAPRAEYGGVGACAPILPPKIFWPKDFGQKIWPKSFGQRRPKGFGGFWPNGQTRPPGAENAEIFGQNLFIFGHSLGALGHKNSGQARVPCPEVSCVSRAETGRKTHGEASKTSKDVLRAKNSHLICQ